MAVYDSLPPEATTGRQARLPKQRPEQTPRQLLAKATTPRKKRTEDYRPQRKSPMQEMSEDRKSGYKKDEKDLAEKKVKGFENNARKIADKQNIPLDRARAILAAGARKASPAAKKANPALKRVPGKAKKA